MRPSVFGWITFNSGKKHWAIVDLLGKGGHVRTVPIPDWVIAELHDWHNGG
jgi:hypothetical protein